MSRSFRIFLFICISLHFSENLLAQKSIQTPRVESKLYLGNGQKQPLVVGLGGSEGGNAWASEHWRETREQFVKQGYAFLALAYFGAQNTPDTLDRIAIEDIYAAIVAAAKDPLVDQNRIAIVGGSRGGDLALLVASHFPAIRCVVALVPSHVAFPGHTSHFSTSAWTFGGRELPFVPVNDAALPYLYKRDLRGAFSQMLMDTISEKSSSIAVERINGPVLLISATHDEIIPSSDMCSRMTARLEQNNFKHFYRHIPVEGGHAAPLEHFNEVFSFLAKHFPTDS